MKTVTLNEAWDFVEQNFPVKNIYDSYVVKDDWMATMDATEERYRISKELIAIEQSFGITKLSNKIYLLQDKLTCLTLPTLGYKYNIPEEIEREIKEEYRKTRKQIEELEERIKELYDTISIEESILHSKKLT